MYDNYDKYYSNPRPLHVKVKKKKFCKPECNKVKT